MTATFFPSLQKVPAASDHAAIPVPGVPIVFNEASRLAAETTGFVSAEDDHQNPANEERNEVKG